jgi:hypothetical protein
MTTPEDVVGVGLSDDSIRLTLTEVREQLSDI